jgi:hypothetical protein
MTRVAFIVNVLRVQGIEVGRAKAEIKLKDATFPAGSFVVKAGQPYWRLAKILLEKQNYPDPALRTYDDSGWTMGLLAQADVKEIADKAILETAVDPVTQAKVTGTIAGSGPVIAVAHTGSNNLVTLRWRLKDARVHVAEKQFTADGREFPAGSLVIASGTADRARKAIDELGLTAAAMASEPDVPLHEADVPRIAMYSSWGSTQETGWVRHAFDKFEVPFDLIFKERVRKGNLRADYDVIVMPNQGSSAKSIVYDIPSRGKPIAYTKTDRFKFLGEYGSSEDITGGMGLEGVVEIQKFVDAGGLLVTLGTASYFPPDFGVARRVDASRPTSQFYAPRPIVQAEVLKTEHPIFYGYTAKTLPVKYVNGPLLQVQTPGGPFGPPPDENAPPKPDAPVVLMRYTGGEAGVLSGLMRNPNEVRNRPAIVDVPAGKGRVLLYATNPVYRWQNWGEFNMLFNALLNYNDLGAAAARTQTTTAEVR